MENKQTITVRSEEPAVSHLPQDLPDRAATRVGAQCRAAGQAEAVPPGGPHWTVRPLVSLGQPSCNRTKHSVTCEERRDLEYTTSSRWVTWASLPCLSRTLKMTRAQGLGTVLRRLCFLQAHCEGSSQSSGLPWWGGEHRNGPHRLMCLNA